MIRKKYGIYVQEKQTIKNVYHSLYYNRFYNYTTVITTIDKLQSIYLHSPEINIQ